MPFLLPNQQRQSTEGMDSYSSLIFDMCVNNAVIELQSCWKIVLCVIRFALDFFALYFSIVYVVVKS